MSSEPPEVPGVSAGADAASTEASDPPLAPVAPSLRRSAEVSGTLTTACLTALWPRSIDWATNAVPVVAAAEPMATPMMVPFTPKADAISAASTAPAAEARIWRSENFMGGCGQSPGTGVTERAMNWRAPESRTQSWP